MVGGDPAEVERCKPVLETFGNPVEYLGALGSGQRAKLVNNALMAAHLGLAEEALALGEKLGMPRDALGRVLRFGSGRSYGLETLVSSGSLGHLASNVYPLLNKDVTILAEVATEETGGVGELAKVARHALDMMTG
jgi:3-hydroxyisobutyrate dehydrogenase-like beta-hydroxyacid dehydrogenase